MLLVSHSVIGIVFYRPRGGRTEGEVGEAGAGGGALGSEAGRLV